MMMRGLLGHKKRTRGGFTLIELAIVLAVTSLLAVGLWRMMSAGNSQLRDQSAADQHKILIKAVRGYLASTEGYAYLSDITNLTMPNYELPLRSATNSCTTPFAGFCNFLPIGFNVNTTNSYGQTYQIRVHRDVTASTLTSYSFMIMTTGGDAIPDTSGGRISSMIGNDGGFRYSTNVCGALARVCGAYGSWFVNPVTDYHQAVAAGHIASRTYVGTQASLESPWLARMPFANNPTHGIGELNTMRTDLSLGGHKLWGNGFDLTTGGGGAGVPGGSIELVSDLRLDGPLLRLKKVCSPMDPNDSTCDAALFIDGGVDVKGLIRAEKFYSGLFVYEDGSDKRLKSEIKPLEHILDKLSKLKAYSYFIRGREGKKFGVIAQEVEKVFPELVHEIEGSYKGVDYIGFVGPLVTAVNELRTENDKLKEDLATQGKAIEEIKLKMEEMAK